MLESSRAHRRERAQIKTDWEGLSQVRPTQARSDQDRPGHVKSGQVKSRHEGIVQVRSGRDGVARLHQDMTVHLERACHVKYSHKYNHTL